jgi:hypothetical protein
VVAIRSDPRSASQLAPVYGVSRSTISYVRSAKGWRGPTQAAAK